MYEIPVRRQVEPPRLVGQGEAVFEDRNVILQVEADLRGTVAIASETRRRSSPGSETDPSSPW